MISDDLQITLNKAIEIAQQHQHEYVCVEHILYSLTENPRAAQIMSICGISLEEIRSDLDNFFRNKLETKEMKKEERPIPTLGFQRVLQRAAQQMLASGKEKIFGEGLIVSIFGEKESFALYFIKKQDVSYFDVISAISSNLSDLDSLLPESGYSDFQNEQVSFSSQVNKDKVSQTDAYTQKRKEGVLSQYTSNLCDKARLGLIDPLIGREKELNRCVQILCRRRKNNPLFVGDSGVGKTALAEGLAYKIIHKKIPESLLDSEIYSLDLGILVAGTKFRGEFEQRLKNLIAELKKKKKSILFIDEIHTMMGAGAVSSGQLDASNILKPALADGELRCIGSTTYKEFRQHIENDHALTRRFQKINIEEPSLEQSVKILKGLAKSYEDFHGVHYSTEALKAAVDLSDIHIKDRCLPDKAIDVLDEAGAQVAAQKSTVKLSQKRAHIGVSQVKEVVASIAGIPTERLSQSDRKILKELGTRLKKVVFGQDIAVEALEQAIHLSRSGLQDQDRPIGSFIFAGPTGVGKTELAKQLSLSLGLSFIRFDMSEYMEKHSVSRLIGAPPGYVGFNEGGLLTDAVHQNHHCVLLLDEIEKAHYDIHNILLQVMDHGSLTDSNGRKADFRNVILIMTSNAGAQELSREGIGFDKEEGQNIRMDFAIRESFSPEFRNRLDRIIQFNNLPKEVMLKIVDKFLKEIELKLKRKKISFSFTDSVRHFLAKKGYSPKYGARPLKRVIQDIVKRPLADFILFGNLHKGEKVFVDLDPLEDRLSFETKKTQN